MKRKKTISQRVKYIKRQHTFMRMLWAASASLIITIALQEPSHALILDPARTALAGDLTSAGFAGVGAVGLFFGLLEFIMISIPIGSGSMALSQMNRGTEAWLPWVTVMGGSLIFIAFVGVLIQQIYGGGAAPSAPAAPGG